MDTVSKHVGLAVFYFLLAILLTGIFIGNKFWLYRSTDEMVFSGTIAAAKWFVLVVAAIIFLKKKKWEFIRRMGWACFIGSCVLFSYNSMAYLALPIGGFSRFILSIALSVLVMIVLYYRSVRKTGLLLRWFWGWLLCLSIAIFLQGALFFKI